MADEIEGESIAVVTPSVEETPSEPTEPVTTTEKVETEQPSVPVEELYELPDGRKVDAATLTKEWKENFLPDYTRKSQKVAQIERGGTPTGLPEDNKPTEYYKDPNWQPKTYAEIIEAAKAEVRNDLQREEQETKEHRTAIETAVATQLTELKAADPNLNENALFAHAVKYGFQDLKVAHANMKDMAEIVKKTQTATVQNIQKRNDPVSVTHGATGARPDPSAFSTAIDYLRSLK